MMYDLSDMSGESILCFRGTRVWERVAFVFREYGDIMVTYVEIPELNCQS